MDERERRTGAWSNASYDSHSEKSEPRREKSWNTGNTYISSHQCETVHVETLKDGKEPTGQEFPTISADEAYDTLKSMRVHGAGRIARFAAQALRDYAKDAKART